MTKAELLTKLKVTQDALESLRVLYQIRGETMERLSSDLNGAHDLIKAAVVSAGGEMRIDDVVLAYTTKNLQVRLTKRYDPSTNQTILKVDSR